MPGYLNFISYIFTIGILNFTFSDRISTNLSIKNNGSQFNLQINNLGLFSDFDGTISNIANRPKNVYIDKNCKLFLSKLSKYFVTGIISGRPVKNIKRLTGINDIYYAGNHGAEIIAPKTGSCSREKSCRQSVDKIYIFPKAQKAAPYIKEIYKALLKKLFYPFELDFKKYSISVHYRNHPNPKKARDTIYNLLNKYLTNDFLEIKEGRMVIELRIKGINKATALKKIIQDERIDNFLYFGDDRTDIDIFKMKKPDHLNIIVKNSEVHKDINKYADIFVKGPSGVAKKLSEILEEAGSQLKNKGKINKTT